MNRRLILTVAITLLALWASVGSCAFAQSSKPLVVHATAATADIRPAGYDYFIEQAELTAKFHGARWSNGDYTTNQDRIISRGQYEPWLCYWKLADHLGGDAELEGYARDACDAWRDEYSIPNSGNVPGYYNYTDGFRWDWVENANTTSRDALIDQAVSASFANGSMSGEYDIRSQVQSREVSYATLGFINSEVFCGEAHNPRLLPYIDLMLGDVDDDVTIGMDTANLDSGGHIEQWLGSYTTDADGDYVSGSTNFVSTNRPVFMDPLTAWTLIQHYENAAAINGGMAVDSRIIPKLIRLSDARWNTCWGTANDAPADDCYYYEPTDFDADGNPNDTDPNDASHTTYALNNMFAAVDWWLFWRTGEQRFLARGDAEFAGANSCYSLIDRESAADATIPPKEFGELLRWTMDGLEFRRLGVIAHGD